jgi:hypothetical protein
MLRWFPTLTAATACFSCSPPDLNFLDPYFIFMYMHYYHCHRVTANLQLKYRVSIKSFLDYRHLLQENYVEYKRIFSRCNSTEEPWLISNLMHKILIYLYIIHLLKSSTFFEHYPAHLQEVYVVIVYMQPVVSSLSAGVYPVHRLRKKK